MSVQTTGAPRALSRAGGFDVVCETKPVDAWLQARKRGIGASDVAAIMGVHPYKSAFEVYMEKLDLLPAQERESDSDESMRWGLLHEPTIAAEMAARLNCDFEMGNHLLSSRKIPSLFATPDAYLFQGSAVVPLQIKITKAHNAVLWEKGIPPSVQIQNTVECLVYGVTTGIVACLIGGDHLVWDRVHLRTETVDAIEVAVLDMMRRIEQRDPPEFVPVNERSLDLMKRLYPTSSGETIALGEAWAGVVGEWAQAQRLEGELRKRKKMHEASLRAAIGDAEVATLPDGNIITLRTTRQPEKVIPACEYRVLRYSDKSGKSGDR